MDKEEYYLDITGALNYYNSMNPENQLTRKELADKLGCSYQSLVNYQNGRHVHSVIHIIEGVEMITGLKKDELIKIKK